MHMTSIHQVELTSRCNLACKYCVHPTMPRAKQDMDEETFAQTLAWVAYFVRCGTQAELNLAGIGESTLHPRFADWCVEARRVLGHDRRLVLATNGIILTDEQAEATARAGMLVWVSLHRPERAKHAVDKLRKAGTFAGVSMDPAMAAVDWAGQVQWKVTAPRSRCPWLWRGWGFVMADGRIGTCCLDGQGTDGIVGHVRNVPTDKVELRPYSLCRNCNQYIA